MPLYGDGANVRGWIHVDDHCRGIQLVLEQGAAGQVYNIDGGTELSNRELTAAILETCGAGWDMVVPVTDRKGHDRRYSLDDSLLRSMGYAPRCRSPTASRPPSSGTRTTAPGGSRSHRPAPPATRPSVR